MCRVATYRFHIYGHIYIWPIFGIYIRHGPYMHVHICTNVDNGQRDSKIILHDRVKSWCHSYLTCLTFEHNSKLHDSSQAIHTGYTRYTVYIAHIYTPDIVKI